MNIEKFVIDILKKHSNNNKIDIKDIRIKICFNEDVIKGVQNPKKILNYYLLNKGQNIKEMNFDEMVARNIIILPFKKEIEGFFVEILQNSYKQLKVLNGEEGEEAKKELIKSMGLNENDVDVVDKDGIDVSKIDVRIVYQPKIGKDKKIKDGYILYCFYNKKPMFHFELSFQQSL